jgi:hypothetical protein
MRIEADSETVTGTNQTGTRDPARRLASLALFSPPPPGALYLSHERSMNRSGMSGPPHADILA